MNAYVLSAAVGLLVGVIYGLLNVRSPAPPVIALVGLLGPLLIIVMGLFVVGIVFAMLMPIFQMNNLIR